MKNKKAIPIAIIIFLFLVCIGTTNSNAATVIKEMTNFKDSMNYGVVEQAKRITNVTNGEGWDSKTSSAWNNIKSGRNWGLFKTILEESKYVYCVDKGRAFLETAMYSLKDIHNSTNWNDKPKIAYILASGLTNSNGSNYVNYPGQQAMWGALGSEVSKSNTEVYDTVLKANAWADYAEKRYNYQKQTSGKSDYEYPEVITTNPEYKDGLAGPFKIDYMYGEYKNGEEYTCIAGIDNMVLKDERGNVIEWNTKSSKNKTTWYIATKDGKPLDNGDYGNKPKPQQEFYIKLVNYKSSKGYLTFTIQKTKIITEWIECEGKMTYSNNNGLGWRCSDCLRGCGQWYQRTVTKTVVETCGYRPNVQYPHKCPRHGSMCNKWNPCRYVVGRREYSYGELTMCSPNYWCGRCGYPKYCYRTFGETQYSYDEKNQVWTAYRKVCSPAKSEAATSQPIIISQPVTQVEVTPVELTLQFEAGIGVDLSLRKFITGINDQDITNRKPQVDTTPIRDMTDTTSIYNHTKEPVKVKAGDLVEYTIRVYNEGGQDAYAAEVTDYLPSNLEFVSGKVDGVDYKWTKSTKNGKTVLKTTYLQNTVLKAFVEGDEFKDNLDYKDLKLICKVKDSTVANEKLTNIAEITKYKDKEGNIIDEDIDSQPTNVNLPKDDNGWQNYNGAGQSGNYIKGQQDDDDFEKLILWYTDMGGTVWEDGQEGKQEERDGVLTNKDKRFANIDVILYQDRNNDGNYIEVNRTKTDNKGTYKFTSLAQNVNKNPTLFYPEEEYRLEVNKNYIIKFGYGGQQYCPVGVTLLTNENYGPTKSAAEDEGRNELNAKFFEIVNGTSKLSNGNTSISLKYDKDEQKHISTLIRDRARQEGEKLWQDSMIYATTHGFSGTNPHVDYINLGLMERAQLNFGIMTDVEKAELTINGKTSTYEHNKRDEGTAMDIELKAQNLNTVYNQAIYKSDYTYRIEDYRQDKLQESSITKEDLANANELEVYPIYKIKIKNYSSKGGNITELVHHFTTEYKMVDSWYVKGDATGKVEWVEASEENGYKTVYTSSTKNIAIGANEDLYVYIKYQVQKNEDRSIKLGEKYTYTEITGYSSAEGLIDTNSEPGNMDMSTLDKYVATYEDDTDRAPGLNLKLSDEPAYREMTGFIFEDTVSGKDSDGVNIGNGTFEQGENKVNNVRVQLIELVTLKDGRTYEYIWQEIFTGNGKVSYMDRNGNLQTNNKQVEVGTGEYKFTEYIPGNYIVRFIYGDTTYNLNYSGQDFKSTTYKGFGENTSSAKDNKARRKQVMDYSTTITNEKGQILAATLQESNEELKVKLAQNTWMNADTQEVMDITVNMENPGHKVNFGLLRRPKTELTMVKEVMGLKVTHNGIIYVDTANGITTGLRTLPDGNYNLQLDDELLNGAVLEATYSVKIVNTGEKDTLYNYFEGDANYGTNQHELITTRADRICDYPENIGYDEGTNPDWTTQNIDTSILSKETQEKINNDKPLVITTTKLTKALKPGEETQKVPMTTSKIMAASGEDDMIYSNVAEIVQVTNKVGRRDEKSIPGDYVPLLHMTEQSDTDDATVTVSDPEGSRAPEIYYILSITIGTMLIAGIVCIKKFVIKK